MGNSWKVWVCKPEGKRPQGRPRGKWKHNTKVAFTEKFTGACEVDLAGLEGDSMTGCLENGNEHSNLIKG